MTRFLREAQVSRVLDERTALRLAEETFRMVGLGKAAMPSKMYLSLPGGNDFRAMPAWVGKGRGRGACGVKWVCVFPKNPSRGLPTVMGTILLNSAETGELLAVLEANAITAIRTAAAAAVATKYLARRGSSVLGIVGAGIQASYQLKALASLLRLKEARVWGFLPGEAERFCRRHQAHRSPKLRPVHTVRECVEGADVVVTVTPSRSPLVKKDWIKKGCHINAMGADAAGKVELHADLTRSAKVVVDEWGQASHSGEINTLVSRGLFDRRRIHAELSEIVTGKKRGRTSADEITVFDSTGLAVLDVHFAAHAYRALSTLR